MKHPNSDEWAEYLGGEMAPEKTRELKQHLEECTDCAAEIAGWQRTLRRLDAWKVPPRNAARAARFPVMPKWAAAAAILIGIGFLGGRSFISGRATIIDRASLEQSIRASIADELRNQLSQDLKNQMASTVVTLRAQFTNEVQQVLNRELAQFAALNSENVKREARRLSDELLQVLQDARETDRRATLALVQQLQKQQATDYLSLRKDLETVASSADDEIRRARASLMQLAVNTEPTRKKIE